MRRFLVIVLLSYFTVYFYLDITYWENNNTAQYANGVTATEQKDDNLAVYQNAQNAHLIETRSAALSLLSE
jgi:hypothetical protein